MKAAKCRYLCVVRHGQRKDHLPEIYPEYKGHPDAPLTDLGFSQALEAGAYVHGLIEKLKDEAGSDNLSVQVDSSPFIRCL